jgi:Flp pilus assembly protein TadB
MTEAIKILGGVAWAIGLVLLLVSPVLGLFVLLVAVVLSVRSVQMTRERRHQEILDAARKQDRS